jgi:cytochrome c551/c552
MIQDAENAEGAFVLRELQASHLLSFLNWRTRFGTDRVSYNTKSVLADGQTRKIGVDFTASEFGTPTDTEAFIPYGQRFQRDRLTDALGGPPVSEKLVLATESVKRKAEEDLVKGDPDVEDDVIPGLQWWTANSGNTSITQQSAGTTAGGAALSRKKVIRASHQTDGPTVLVCGHEFEANFRNDSQSRVEFVDMEAAGGATTRITVWEGIPILSVGLGNDELPILGFTELDQPAGASTATSIYLFGHNRTRPVNKFQAWQSSALKVHMLAEANVLKEVDIEWVIATTCTAYGAIRIRHIGDLDLVA